MMGRREWKGVVVWRTRGREECRGGEEEEGKMENNVRGKLE